MCMSLHTLQEIHKINDNRGRRLGAALARSIGKSWRGTRRTVGRTTLLERLILQSNSGWSTLLLRTIFIRFDNPCCARVCRFHPPRYISLSVQ